MHMIGLFVHLTLCHSHLTALLFISTLPFFYSLFLSFGSLLSRLFQRHCILFILFMFDSQLRVMPFDSIIFMCWSFDISLCWFHSDWKEWKKKKRMKNISLNRFSVSSYKSFSRLLLFNLILKWFSIIAISPGKREGIGIGTCFKPISKFNRIAHVVQLFSFASNGN